MEFAICAIAFRQTSIEKFPPFDRCMTDIFISYSRRDKAFVRALNEALKHLNRTTWVDWRDIAPAVEWEKSIYEGIERAKKFVYVISPDSVASKYCDDEVNHAVRHRKPCRGE
ncbi:MAG TPA: toll/interleukin-1 receptor domain-containing protein [Coleofasciculaceae cyanobacterium]